jgi:uncharacterized protein DUF3592
MIGLIFAGVGALELLIGAFFFFRTRSFLERAVSASGTVVGFATSHSSEGGTSYHPIVEFQAADGQAHRFQDSMGSNPPGFEEGESVPLKYDPSNPGKARINKPFRLWFVAGLLGGMGLLFLVIGLGLLAAGV